MFVNLDEEFGERFDFGLELGILTIFLQQISNFPMRVRELLLQLSIQGCLFGKLINALSDINPEVVEIIDKLLFLLTKVFQAQF
jgi:hypothetical protein